MNQVQAQDAGMSCGDCWLVRHFYSRGQGGRLTDRFTLAVASATGRGVVGVSLEDRSILRIIDFANPDGGFTAAGPVSVDGFGRIVALDAADDRIRAFDSASQSVIELNWAGSILDVTELAAKPYWRSSQPTPEGYLIAGVQHTADHFGYRVHWVARSGELIEVLNRVSISDESGRVRPVILDDLPRDRVALVDAGSDTVEIWFRPDSAAASKIALGSLAGGFTGAVADIEYSPGSGHLLVAVNHLNSPDVGRPAAELMDLGAGEVLVLDIEQQRIVQRFAFDDPIVSMDSDGFVTLQVGPVGGGGASVYSINIKEAGDD